jgi:hypothetical protein
MSERDKTASELSEAPALKDCLLAVRKRKRAFCGQVMDAKAVRRRLTEGGRRDGEQHRALDGSATPGT